MKKKLELSAIELVRIIQKRPKMWLQDISLSMLWTFLCGFELNSKKETVPSFSFFNDFVSRKFNLSSGMGYVNQILNSCDNNEEKAFYKFFELLDEYVLISPKAIYVTDVNEDNFALYYSKEHKSKPYRVTGVNFADKTIYPAPYHIKLIEFEFATYSYHYDFLYMTKDTLSGWFSSYYLNLKQAKKQNEELYGKLQWLKTDRNDLEKEFETIILNQTMSR